jgi:hypothetical protein
VKSFSAFMKSSQPQFDQKIQEEFDQDDELSSRTLEQFKNLRKINGNMSKKRKNQRSTANKSGALFPGISHSRLMNNSNSKTRRDNNASKSRSRSPNPPTGSRVVNHLKRVSRTGWNGTRDDADGLFEERANRGTAN